jgi:TolA-binding protein
MIVCGFGPQRTFFESRKVSRMSERLTRRELKKDQFLEAVLAGVTWAKSHVLVAATIGLVVIMAVTLAVRVAGSSATNGRGNPKAERALAEARAAFGTGGLPAGISALESVRSKHGRSAAGREATYLLGNALFEAGEFQKSKEAYEEYLRHPAYGDLMRDGASLGIAGCLEELGDHASAAKAYREIWETGRTPAAKAQAALASARCMNTQGATAEALGMYKDLIAAYPDSPEAAEAQFALQRVEGGDSPKGGPPTAAPAATP